MEELNITFQTIHKKTGKKKKKEKKKVAKDANININNNFVNVTQSIRENCIVFHITSGT